ncbi:hypothetical protein LTR56_016039 [Elasticomyces elasticus]|nr:hypothetical protein LTR56_016039 [Elasticomyces elasticus]KAK4926968.1 hypothetical protein LTR49_006125 [Elasticomyces elasticus]KAK5764296.1 hypothetical protein LTS12_005509 [Elasticomyces elasticus]
MAPKRPAYDDDWVWSEQSNVHVANHPDWFVSFTCFETHSTAATNLKVLGIGDIELVLRTKLEVKGQNKIGIGLATIVLRDVLYAPDAASNIVGSPLLADYDLSGTFRNTTIVDKESREVLGILDYCGRKKLLLERQRPGKRNLRLDCAPQFSVQWSEDERELWDAHKLFRDQSPKAGANDHIPPLNKQEKTWVKLSYRGKWEDNFAGLKTLLNSYGLLLTDAKDRQTGCLLIRTLMSKTGYQGAKQKLSTVPPFSASEKLWVATNFCNEGNVFDLLMLEESKHRHREICRLCVRASIDTEEGLQAMLSSTKELTPAEELWVVREFRSEEKLLRFLKLDRFCDRHIGVCRLYVRISAQYGGGGGEEKSPSSDKMVVRSSGKKAAVHQCSDEELMTWEQLCDTVAPYAHGVCFSKAQRTWIMDRYDTVTVFLEAHDLQVDTPANRVEAAAKMRKLMKRQQTVPMPGLELPSVEADVEEKIPSIKPSFGQRMLERQGWSAGQGLGAAGKGIAEPLMSFKGCPRDRRGLGIRPTTRKERAQRDAHIDREGGQKYLAQEGYKIAILPVSHATPTLDKRGCTQERIAQDQIAGPLDEVETDSLEDTNAVVGTVTRVESADKHVV